MKDDVELSIIIVSWNTSRLLSACLESLQSNEADKNVEIIVVDNASSDDSVAMLKREHPEIKCIENPTNVGFGLANNIGFAHSRGQYILLLNPDTVVDSNAVFSSLSFLKSDLKIGALGCRLRNLDGSNQDSCGYFPSLKRLIYQRLILALLRFKFTNTALKIKKISQLPWPPLHEMSSYWDFMSVVQVDWVIGAFLMLPRSVAVKTQLFDPRFFIHRRSGEHAYL